MDNPDAIRYADLIVPDSSIENLISQLKQVIDEYDTLKTKTQASAKEMAAGLQAVSGATEEQRKAIQQTTEQTEKLEQDYRRIFAAQMEAKEATLKYKAAKKEEEQVTKLLQQLNVSQEGSYNRLSAQYRLNKLRLNEMSAAQRMATDEGRKLEQETAAIMKEMQRLQDVTGKHQLHVGEYEIAAKGLRSQIMDLTQEMVRLRMEGKQGSAEYQEVAARAGQLKDAFNDAQKEVQNMASDTSQLDAVMKGASAARGGMGAFVGLMGLMGANSEGASKAQKILGSAIAVVSGLTAIQNALQKQSSLMIALRTIKTKLFTKSLQEETAATQAHTAAEMADAAATNVATKATKGFQKALIATGIGAVVVLLGELIAHWHEFAEAIGLTDEASDKYFADMAAGLERMEAAMNEQVKIAQAMGKTNEEVMMLEIEKLQELSSAQYEYYSQQYDAYNDLTLVEQWFAKESNESIEEMWKKHKETFDKLQEKIGDLKVAVIGYIHSQDTAIRQQGMTEFEVSLDNVRTKAVMAGKAIDALVKQKKISEEEGRRMADEVIATMEWEMEQAAEIEKERRRQEAERRAQKVREEKKAVQDIEDNAAEALMTESQRLTKKYEEDLAKLEKFGIDSKNLTLKYQQDLAKIEEENTKKAQEEQKKRLSAEEKALKMRLDLAKEGSAEQEALQAELWEKQRQKELYENSLLDEAVKQNEADINAKWDAYIFKQTTENAKKRAEELLKIQQKYDESEFALLDRNERQKNIFKLNQQKATLLAQLDMAEKYGKEMTEQERQTIKNTIAAIEKEIASTGYSNLYELLGINLSSGQQDALNTALDSVKDSIKGVTDAWKDAADRAVESANEQVESAERILQAEIEARNAGYANNVETARKELALAQETQKKAKAEREKAQKAAIAADAIAQSSSLVTASANIWKAFSGAGIIGPALAIAAIGTMWASFIASKARASELATEKYSEGTIELLQGGSHASGNDIDLGRTRTGKRRRAEGGEFFAIINKRNSRRFRSVIPDVINSFNNGTFAERYQRANGSLNGLSLNYAGADVSGLERDVRAIRQQGEISQTMEGGYIVERYKNLTKKYKA